MTNGALLLSLLPALVPLAPTQEGEEQDESAGLWSEDLRAGSDEKKRYFLIGREDARAPREGFKLLLVLPGGDGSADFHPFVKRIHRNALDETYLAAQLVAPVWSADQSKSLVWPIEKNPWHGMEFSTEELLSAVVADVETRHEIDPSFVFTLAWSSSGPAAYAWSVDEETRVTGTFVAMSVFKPGQMASLKKAEGQAYFLLHSPDDFISMAFPEAALEKLARAGAEVELVTYPGGHGWRGDVYGNLRRGVAFLEEHHAKPRKVKGRARR